MANTFKPQILVYGATFSAIGISSRAKENGGPLRESMEIRLNLES